EQSKALRVRESPEQNRGGEAADESDQQLDIDEPSHQAASKELAQPASDTHCEQIAADDGGKLENAIAEQVAREGACDQLINEPARREQENRYEENYRHSVHCRR